MRILPRLSFLTMHLKAYISSFHTHILASLSYCWFILFSCCHFKCVISNDRQKIPHYSAWHVTSGVIVLLSFWGPWFWHCRLHPISFTFRNISLFHLNGIRAWSSGMCSKTLVNCWVGDYPCNRAERCSCYVCQYFIVEEWIDNGIHGQDYHREYAVPWSCIEDF